jgi:hypothetical protein
MNAALTFRCFALAYRVAGPRREAFLEGWREEVALAEDEAMDLFPRSEQLNLF